MTFLEFFLQIIFERSIEVFLFALSIFVLLMILIVLRRSRKLRESKRSKKIFSGVIPEVNAFSPTKNRELQIEPNFSIQSSVHVNHLIDIEEALLALRELYQRKLIDADLYVKESMKHAARLNFAKGSI
jgi:hypothetical protein